MLVLLQDLKSDVVCLTEGDAVDCTAEDSTMQVPGSLGYGILGDKSIELVRSPLDFIAQRRRTYGAVFQARILNKQHIFLTSNEAVEELLIG